MSKAAKTMAAFVNTSKTSTAAWLRFAKSTVLTIAYNPESETFDYISDETPSDEIKQYKPSFEQDITIDKEYPDYEYFNEMRHELPVGSEAHREVLTVDYTDGDNENGFYAEVQNAIISFTDYNTTDGKLNIHIAFCGNRTIGTCTVTGGTPTFTPA